MARRANIEVEIGALELHGFPAAGRHAIAAAFERELGELLGRRGLPAGVGEQSGQRAQLELRVPTLDPRAPPTQIGVTLARSIFAGLCESGGQR